MLASHPGGAPSNMESAYASLTVPSLCVPRPPPVPPAHLPCLPPDCPPVSPTRPSHHSRRPDLLNPPRLRFANKIARAKTIKAEFVKKAEHQAKEGRKVADILAEGAIVGVGLIQRDKAGEEAK